MLQESRLKNVAKEGGGPDILVLFAPGYHSIVPKGLRETHLARWKASAGDAGVQKAGLNVLRGPRIHGRSHRRVL